MCPNSCFPLKLPAVNPLPAHRLCFSYTLPKCSPKTLQTQSIRPVQNIHVFPENHQILKHIQACRSSLTTTILQLSSIVCALTPSELQQFPFLHLTILLYLNLPVHKNRSQSQRPTLRPVMSPRPVHVLAFTAAKLATRLDKPTLCSVLSSARSSSSPAEVFAEVDEAPHARRLFPLLFCPQAELRSDDP